MSGNGHDGPANAYRGEARITLGGQVYVLRLSVNVLASLEDVLDAGNNFAQMLIEPCIRTVRAVFQAALTVPGRGGARQMPAETTLHQVGDLLDEAGGFLKGSPVAFTYWTLVVNAGYADRDKAEDLGLLPPGKGDAGTAALVPVPAKDAPETAGT